MPNVQFGKYKLERPLAQGGMAEIFLARQSGPEGFEKVVVIKRVLPHLAQDKSFQTMFLDEARIAARLDHPGIVQIFDFGETDGSYYIAMEYLAGEDFASLLKAELARHATVPQPIAALLLSAVCDALHYAHTFTDERDKPLNIVHRDISPSNLFLTYAGAVKVLDFGLAKAEGKKNQTMDGQLKGKYLYMSPEQFHGKKLDARSDVFALGAVLHELLAGQPTFQRAEPVLVLKAISEEPPIPLSDLVPGISPELEAIAAKALEKDPARRFQSALEMRQALDKYLATTARGSPTAQLQDYVRSLVPADQIQKKTRPLAAAPEPSAAEADGAPTHLRMAVVAEESDAGKVASTHPRLDVLPSDAPTPSPDSTAPELAPIKIDRGDETQLGVGEQAEGAQEEDEEDDEEADDGPVDQDGETVLDVPAFRRDQPQPAAPPPPAAPAPAPAPKRNLSKPPAKVEPVDDGQPTDRGIIVTGLDVEPEAVRAKTRPSAPSMPELAAAKSQAGPRSWPALSALDTAPPETRSPLAEPKATQVMDPVEEEEEGAEGAEGAEEPLDEQPPSGLLAKIGLTTTQDLVLAGVGLALCVAAVVVFVVFF